MAHADSAVRPTSDDDVLDAFKHWQSCGLVHELTCGGGGGPCSGVALDVFDVLLDGSAKLRCPECWRIQTEPPGGDVMRLVLTHYRRRYRWCECPTIGRLAIDPPSAKPD